MNPKLVFWLSSALSAASPAALSADWIALGLDGRGNAWHIDRSSVVREADGVTAWKRIAFREPPPQLGGGTAVKVALVRDVTDCGQRQVGVKELKLLGADGAVLSAHEQRSQGIGWPTGGHAIVQEKAISLLCSDAWR